jgi:heavy metal sensor kinase
MESARRPTRLGTRLTRSYVLLAAAIIVVFTTGTAAALFIQMRDQLSHFAIEDIETVEGLLSFTPDGHLALREDYHNHPESKRVLDHYIEILDPAGNVLYRNAQLGTSQLDGPPAASEGVGGYSQRWSRLSDGTRIVLVSRRHVLQGRSLLIRLAQTEEPVWRALRLFGTGAAMMFAIVIGAAILVARSMSRRILAPVQNIAALAEQITSHRLHERIPLRGTADEIDQLAEVFNRTLTRLDESFRQLRQFTSDASHELHTPLAAIRAVGEVGLERDGTTQEYRELIGSMLEEVARLTHLVDDLLMISRGETGSIQLDFAAIRVTDLLKDTVSLLEPLADEKEQELAVSDLPPCEVRGDATFLRQALINVVHNAIKYSPPHTTIHLAARPNPNGDIVISIRDEGQGIAPEHLPHIFDRFYRADAGRSRDVGGFGLGLAISQWAVQAHHGSIEVISAPGAGATFQITLPGAEPQLSAAG